MDELNERMGMEHRDLLGARPGSGLEVQNGTQNTLTCMG
jgi:hypothetical protein